MQADEFFNAYLVLKSNNEAIHANFSKAPEQKVVGKNELRAWPTPIVEIVCLSFSLELYIKDLFSAIGIDAPRSHKIRELFDGLPEKTRNEIFSHESISQNPFHTRGNLFSAKRCSTAYKPYDGFVEQIDEISEGFTKWRYSHEYSTLYYSDSFAVALIEAIKAVTNTVRQRSMT